MAREFDAILKEMAACIDGIWQPTIIGPNYWSMDELCEEWLKARGYSIRPPYKFPNKIKKLDDLIILFYSLYTKRFPGKIAYVKDEKEERKTASRFVKSRMESGSLDRNTAMQECGEIIKTVFEDLDRFNFTVPITFGIFGQKSMSWVTNVAVDIMNEKINRYRHIEGQKYADKVMAERAKTHKPGWTEEELDEAIKNLEEKGNG